MRGRDLEEGLAGIDRLPHLDVEHPAGIGVLWVGVDVRVVPGALAQVAVVGAAHPRLAAVVGAVDATVRVLDHRVDAATDGRRDDDADLALDPLRQAGLVVEPLPAVAAIARAPEAGALATGRHEVRPALGLPRPGEDDARVVRVDREVVDTGPLGDEEDVVPGLAAVQRAVEAALGVRAVGVPEGGDVDAVGIARVNAHLADVARLLQPEVLPGLAGVGAAVDAVAVADVATDRGLAHPDVDDVRVRLGDGDPTDRGALEVAVGDVLPVSVRRLSSSRRHHRSSRSSRSPAGWRAPPRRRHAHRASAQYSGTQVAATVSLCPKSLSFPPAGDPTAGHLRASDSLRWIVVWCSGSDAGARICTMSQLPNLLDISYTAAILGGSDGGTAWSLLLRFLQHRNLRRWHRQSMLSCGIFRIG